MQNPTSHAYQVSASIRSQRGQHEQAISDAERAIALDPNDADSYAAFAGVLNLAGQPQVALEIMERAIRLSSIGNVRSCINSNTCFTIISSKLNTQNNRSNNSKKST